jgi:hypothetical protein
MIEVPTVPAPQKTVAALQQNTAILATGYRVLCLDNDETILDGMPLYCRNGAMMYLRQLNQNKP